VLGPEDRRADGLYRSHPSSGGWPGLGARAWPVPAWWLAKPLPGDLVDNMTKARIRLTVCRLKRDPLLRRLIADGGLLIIGGYYHLRSGIVDIVALSSPVQATADQLWL
jgi:hypothetical protein